MSNNELLHHYFIHWMMHTQYESEMPRYIQMTKSRSPRVTADSSCQARCCTLITFPDVFTPLGIPTRPGPPVEGELCTPTGVALVKALVGEGAWGRPPLGFTPTSVGLGAGTKDFPGHPNVVSRVPSVHTLINLDFGILRVYAVCREARVVNL